MSRLEQVLVGIGKGSSRVEIVSSAILALVTIFYAYAFSSFLKLQVFVLRDRVVYDEPFNQYLLGNFADHLIISLGLLVWLYLTLRISKTGYIVCLAYAGTLIASILLGQSYNAIFSITIFPVVASVVIYQKLSASSGKKGILVTMNRTLYLEYFTLILIVLSALSIIVSLQSLLSVNFSANSIRNYSYEISTMLSPVSAFLLALLIFAYPLKLIIRELFPFLKNLLPRSNDSKASLSELGYNEKGVQFSRNKVVLRQRNEVLYLLPLLALSVCLALIPYQPAMNEDNRLVGVDTPIYAAWIDDVVKSSEDGLGESLRQIFSEQGVNDRPLSLIIMFLAVKITNTPDIMHMLDHSPIFLSPMLVLSGYFLTRQLTSSYTTSYVAAFLTIISFQVLIGIFAGFYANWIALITGYFSLGFLFRFLQRPQTNTLTIFAALLIATLFAHVYTWAILSLCTGMFLILLLLLRRRDYSRKAILLALLIVGVSAAVDISKSLVTNSSSGIFQDVELSGALMGHEEFARRWDILIFTVHSGLGGMLANSVVMLLGLYWVFKSDYKKPSTLFLLVFLSMAILPLFFGDWVIQSRTIYLIPFQIPASLGLSYLLVKKKTEKANLYTSEQNWSILGTTSVVAICAVLFAVAVSILSNIYLVLPS
jgi:hypothetical protein